MPDDRFFAVPGGVGTALMFPDNLRMPANQRMTVTWLEVPSEILVKGLP